MTEPQLCVCSARARDLAHRLARRENRSIAEIVERALEAYGVRETGREPARSFYERLRAQQGADIDLEAIIREGRTPRATSQTSREPARSSSRHGISDASIAMAAPNRHPATSPVIEQSDAQPAFRWFARRERRFFGRCAEGTIMQHYHSLSEIDKLCG